MAFKIILQLIVGIGLILTVILDYKWYDKRTIKFKSSRNVLLTLTLLALILSIINTYNDEIERNSEKIAHQKQLNNMIDSLSEIKAISFEMTQQLEPIIQLAKSRYPNLETGDALKMVKKEIDSLENRTLELEGINKTNLIEKANFEKLKRTKPKFNCNLKLELDNDEIYLTLHFEFLNEVPIYYRPSIENNEKLDIAPRLFSKLPECYPSKENGKWFKYKYGKIKDLRYLNGNKNIITMTVAYKSVYSEQVPEMDLGGKVTKKYNLDFTVPRLTEI
jgi:hypothetical protein